MNYKIDHQRRLPTKFPFLWHQNLKRKKKKRKWTVHQEKNLINYDIQMATNTCLINSITLSLLLTLGIIIITHCYFQQLILISFYVKVIISQNQNLATNFWMLILEELFTRHHQLIKNGTYSNIQAIFISSDH